MKFSAEELNIIRQADAIIAGKITTTDFITGADAARSLLRFRLAAEQRESFCAFFLNCHNGVIAFEELFKGTISSVTVHPRIVLQRALHHNAAAVVLAHNHPSANTAPSQADKLITERLAQVLGMVDVKVLDHLIVGGSDIYSFAEHGLI
ncbi:MULTISPECIES: JAB domain-containing protein [Enterobacteriaceae]|jgi:DNA repair protein RadC|uniref:DNA repair protein RadC n=3 Tax=Enterobacteriaceae TaxID=543 RepID=A0ABD5BZ75_ECOLX|nr:MULTISPECIES: JAB domain-containing protein [Enterobacteriaceae]EAA5356648.1 DNA repair protein RadC [Salmonella enterica subsp. enterica serovar Virchow]EBY0708846.1 DNA repair protein RadC [Salmonella enterica subsp. enterica serovar Kentucky]ECY3593919.1 DNA repair protein RadC [Salmonella enterica subsp. enterica serovar Stanley]EDV6349657.1 DNA repair protein RadC [Salmonella enterica subsp. enterica]EDZ3065764.1 DNA repair protein RadC [Salmonella enterica]EGR9720644.1 DNA repair pro